VGVELKTVEMHRAVFLRERSNRHLWPERAAKERRRKALEAREPSQEREREREMFQ
jgi:hypothetical protein